MKTLRTRFSVLLIVLLISLNISPVSAQLKSTRKAVKPQLELPAVSTQGAFEDPVSAAMVEKLLAVSGVKYTSAGLGVWIIRRTGSNLKYFQLVLSTGRGGILFTEVTVAKGKSLRLNEAALSLLRLANKMDYVKVGLDKDDDLFVRNEARLKSLDVDEFKINLDRVAAAADLVYAELQPFRNF
jgi:hypothetical protein